LRPAILLGLVNLPDPLNPSRLLDLVNPSHPPDLLARSRQSFQRPLHQSHRLNPLHP
jgi:hypothetical protein